MPIHVAGGCKSVLPHIW